MMVEQIDARGLSCPQPVILARQRMQSLGKGVFELRIDTDTAKENVSRLAAKEGWELEIKEEGGEFRLILKKS